VRASEKSGEFNRAAVGSAWAFRATAAAAAPWPLWMFIGFRLHLHEAVVSGTVVAGMVACRYWRHPRRAWPLVPVAFACGSLGAGLASVMIPTISPEPMITTFVAWICAAGSYEVLRWLARRLLDPDRGREWTLEIVGHVGFFGLAALGPLVLPEDCLFALPTVAVWVAGLAAGLRGEEAPVRRPSAWGWVLLALAVAGILFFTVVTVRADPHVLPHLVSRGIEISTRNLFPMTLLSFSIGLCLLAAGSAVRQLVLSLGSPAARRAGVFYAVAWLSWAAFGSLWLYAAVGRAVPASYDSFGECPDGGIPPDGMDC